MPSEMFRITVGGGKIRALREPRTGDDIPSCDLVRNDLQFRTTKLLVEMLREGRLITRADFQILGENLYKILFDNDNNDNKVGKALKDAFDPPPDLLRVELEFEEEASELTNLPWEYVYLPADSSGGGYFLAEQRSVVLTRRLRLEKSRSLRIDKPPLKILFVASSPEDMVLNARTNRSDLVQYSVEYEKVLEVLQGFDPEMIKVTPLLPYEADGRPRATWSNFVAMLENEEFHAIHFLGHGKWDQEKRVGTILFMKKDKTPEPISDNDLATTLKDFPSIRLVFLQACESAYSDPYQAFSGVAQQLAQKKIPAVVGMQYKIHQQVANAFASEFYASLAQKYKVDVALQKARRKIKVEFTDSIFKLAFGFPVLYLRESESLFDTSTVNAPEKTFSCPWCNVSNSMSDKFCGDCGGALVCKCDARVDRRKKVCGKCGSPLSEGKPLASGVPTAGTPAARDKFEEKLPVGAP